MRQADASDQTEFRPLNATAGASDVRESTHVITSHAAPLQPELSSRIDQRTRLMCANRFL
eukprot:745092-Pyramimonas_sp.AAC.1